MRYGVSFHLYFFIHSMKYVLRWMKQKKKMENKNDEEVWSLNVARGFNTPFFPNENDNLIIYPYELAALWTNIMRHSSTRADCVSFFDARTAADTQNFIIIIIKYFYLLSVAGPLAGGSVFHFFSLAHYLYHHNFGPCSMAFRFSEQKVRKHIKYICKLR